MAILDMLIIKTDCQWKAAFDLVMVFASCENTFS